MKTFILTPALLICIYSLKAQSSDSSPESSRLSIGAGYSLDYCNRTLKSTDNSETASFIMDMRDEYEEGRRGYTTGLSVNYLLTRKLSVETGLFYSVKGYRFKELELTFGDLKDDRFGSSFASQSYPVFDVKGILYEYKYLDVPLKLIYMPGQKKIRFMASTGLAVNFLLKSTQTFTYEYADGSSQDVTQERPYDFNTLNLTAFAGVGMEYRTGMVRFRLESVTRYGLLKLINTPITEYLWSAGLGVSCFYVIK